MKGIKWMFFFALALILITWFYTQEMAKVGTEQFRPSVQHALCQQSPGLFPDVEIADIGQGPLLSDFLRTKKPDQRGFQQPDRHLELGGCYVQQTNNYPHDFPDAVSPWTHFVGSLYERN